MSLHFALWRASVLLWYYLWTAPHVFQVALLFAMLRQRLYRRFPVFFAYTASVIAEFIWLFFFAARAHASGYLLAYSVDLLTSTAVRFAVLIEVFADLFKEYNALRRLGKPLMTGSFAALVAAAAILAVCAPGNNPNHVLWIALILDRTGSMLQCGMLLLLFLFSRYIGLSWRSPAFGIALGLGIFACVELGVAAIRTQFGSPQPMFLDFLTMFTYQCCVLIWLFYMWAPERKPAASAIAVPEHDLEAWKTELQRLVQR